MKGVSFFRLLFGFSFMVATHSANAASISYSGSFLIDETTLYSGAGFGQSQFYMPGNTLVDVQLTIDANLEYSFSSSYKLLTELSGGPFSGYTYHPPAPVFSYVHSEMLTIDDGGDLFSPTKLTGTGSNSCTSELRNTIPSFPITSPYWLTTCSVSGSESFSSIPVDITGIIPDDFTGFDILNFSAISSASGQKDRYIAGIEFIDESREFEWSGNYTLTYIYDTDIPPIPVPAAVWLFGTALVGFIGISRRRKVA